jgi:hypothetical protein
MSPLSSAVQLRYPKVARAEPHAAMTRVAYHRRMPLRVRRTRRLPADLVAVHEAFERCAEHVDLAQRAMLRCVPSSARSIALPLEVGAETVRMSLAAARDEMPAWRHELVAGPWAACMQAIDATLSHLDGAVLTAAATDELDVALTAVQDLLEPLHAFVDAAERFTALRVRDHSRRAG